MIVTCGEAIVDLLPERSDGALVYRPVLGGSHYTVAVGIAQLGGEAGYLWELSADDLGQELLAHLETVGVDTSAVRIADRPCPVAVVDLSHAEPRYAIADPGRVMEDTVPPPPPAAMRCLHVGSAVLAREPVAHAIAELAEHAPLLSIDFNVRPPSVTDWDRYRARLVRLSRRAGVVKASVADLALLGVGDPHAFMQGLVADGAGAAILTAAENGAFAWSGAERAFAPSRAVRIVDTVGAGDAFMAAALVHLQQRGLLTRDRLGRLEAADLAAMLELAQRAAAVVCGRRGAVMPLPADLADPFIARSGARAAP